MLIRIYICIMENDVSTLLMNDALKKEYDKVTKEIIEATNEFFNKINIVFQRLIEISNKIS